MCTAFYKEEEGLFYGKGLLTSPVYPRPTDFWATIFLGPSSPQAKKMKLDCCLSDIHTKKVEKDNWREQGV